MVRPVTALALALSLALSPRELELHYAPSEGSQVRRVFETDLALSFDELSSRMGGVEVPAEYLPEIEIEIEECQRVEVTDTLVRVAGGRPAILLRSFETISSSLAMDFLMTPPGISEFSSAEGESALEGRAVRFEWNPERGEYDAAFEDEGESGQAELLEELIEDMDLRGFLPESAQVAVGARWTVPAWAFATLLAPGGDLSIVREGDDWSGARYLEPEGQLTAELLRVLEQDGARLAEIALAGEVVLGAERDTDLAHIPVVDGAGTESARSTYDVEGHLWWNLDQHRAHSAELAAELTREVTTRKNEGEPGPDFESTMRLIGSWSARMSTERPD